MPESAPAGVTTPPPTRLTSPSRRGANRPAGPAFPDASGCHRSENLAPRGSAYRRSGTGSGAPDPAETLPPAPRACGRRDQASAGRKSPGRTRPGAGPPARRSRHRPPSRYGPRSQGFPQPFRRHPPRHRPQGSGVRWPVPPLPAGLPVGRPCWATFRPAGRAGTSYRRCRWSRRSCRHAPERFRGTPTSRSRCRRPSVWW